MTGSATVLLSVSDGVGTLSMNRPDRHNAISDQMFDEWVAGLHSLLADPVVRVILLRGEGRSFCSGRDTAQLGERTQGESDQDFLRRHQQPRLAMLDSPKPIVAAVHGYTFGGGLEIALAADIRVAASDTVLAMPEIRYALLPDTGGTQLLAALAGPARAKYLVMTGARIDAEQALDWGLVEFVVAPDELDEHAWALCTQLADKSPTALAFGKQLVDHATADGIRAGIEQELIVQTALFESPEYLAAKASRTHPAPAGD